MNKSCTNIINIDDMNKIDIINNIDPKKIKITINFEESSVMTFNKFINNHLNLKDIYINNNYKLNIDLVNNYFELYLFFVECIENSYDYILNGNYEYKELFGNINTWNFCIFQNIMFNLPFTLDDIIYMPFDYIQENYINNDYKSLIRTIIHEKLHVGQRFNEVIWNKYINDKDSNWIKINFFDEQFKIIENNLKNNKTNLINDNEEFISNPDTYYINFKYLYKMNNKLYYAHYIFNSDNKNIFIRYFELDIEKKILFKTNNNFKEDHPYETFAYIISEKIV